MDARLELADLLSAFRQVNTFASRQLKYLNNASIAFHSLGVFAISVAILAKAPTHQSAKDIFLKFNDSTGVDGAAGWSERASPAYTAIIGCLMAQYTITGLFSPFLSLSCSDVDSFTSTALRSFQDLMHRRTWLRRRRTPPGRLLWACSSRSAPAVSCVPLASACSSSSLLTPPLASRSPALPLLQFGFFYIVSLLFSMQSLEETLESPIGQPVFTIIISIFGPSQAKGLIVIILICVWFAGLFSLTSNRFVLSVFAQTWLCLTNSIPFL